MKRTNEVLKFILINILKQANDMVHSSILHALYYCILKESSREVNKNIEKMDKYATIYFEFLFWIL